METIIDMGASSATKRNFKGRPALSPAAPDNIFCQAPHRFPAALAEKPVYVLTLQLNRQKNQTVR
jgi:hypothetical protein